MGIGMIVVLVAVVLLVVYLVRSTTNQQAQTHPPAYYAAAAQPAAEQRALESARDIVQRRYAGGEIDREEYLQKLKDLWEAPRRAGCKKAPPRVLRVV